MSDVLRNEELPDLIKKHEKFILSLQDINDQLKNKNIEFNSERKTGCVLSCLGTAANIGGIFLAVPTGGLSLLVGTYLGTSLSISGALYSYKAEHDRSKETVLCNGRLIELLKQNEIEFVRKQNDILQEIFNFTRNCCSGYGKCNACMQIANSLCNLIQNRSLQAAGSMLKNSQINGWGLQKAKRLCNAGLERCGITGVRVGARYIFAGIGITLAVYDVWSYWKTKTSKSQFEQHLDSIIKKANTFLNALRKIRDMPSQGGHDQGCLEELAEAYFNDIIKLYC